MRAVPPLTPFTTPEEDTVAILLLEEYQVIVAVALDGESVDDKETVSPTLMVLDSGMDMPVGITGFTVTTQDADFPFDVVTVIVALPGYTPFTTPEEETVAMLVLLDFHVYVVVALDGVTVGYRVVVFPTFTDVDEGSDMPVGSILFLTVTS